ncbi:SDR family NAD(P)-dependent oxidoreductase [Xanthobacter wiegelii]|uniref:SDR family NAD(P)-dependent oxidoreductase n=1 Tax=Xanthobacter wiegelii TaxID=3119913 RepID=UPI003729394A
MNIDLTGKTALVTGSSEGIGFAIAQGLAQAGAAVVVNGRSEAKVAEAVGRIGGAARGRAIDLGTAEGAAALVAAEPAFDIVVNNLGIFQPSDFFETDDDVWDRHWAINVMSGVRLARAYLPGMAARGWGRMLFLGSESAFNIPADMIHYGVSKTADVSLARGLAKRMAGTGVTVNSILPGPTLSEGVAAMLKDAVAAGKTLEEAGADFVKAHRPSSIIQRPARVEEVANMAVYIASPLASATTGAALRVDGGVIDFIV